MTGQLSNLTVSDLKATLTGNSTGIHTGTVVNPTYTHATMAANVTATLTAAQVAGGWITSTSLAPVSLTLPTGTLLGKQLGAVKGTVVDLYIDNTGGSSNVSMLVGVNGILSAAAAAGVGAAAGLIVVASGVTGLAKFTLMFSSATAYTFTRTA